MLRWMHMLMVAVMVAGGLVAWSPAPVAAAVIAVPCSVPDLKAAITTSAPGDTLSLAAGCTYTLTDIDNAPVEGANGLPSFTKALIIQGNGAIIERAAAAPRFRVLHVGAAGNLQISQATIRGGFAEGGFNGGGIFILTDGALTLVDSTVSGNATGTGAGSAGSIDFAGSGGSGGGIFVATDGALTLTNSAVSGNTTGNGGNAAVDGFAGNGGEGGGIFNRGRLTLTNSAVSGNTTGNGGNAAAGGNAGTGGEGGDGGGILNIGVLTLTNSAVSSNSTGVGGAGGDDVSGTAGGVGGNGGGIANQNQECCGDANLTLIQSTVSGNITGGGGDGGSASDGTGGAGGAGGAGGGIVNSFGDLTLANSTVSGNTTGPGGRGGDGGPSGVGGDGGDGGGITIRGDTSLTNTTITGNATGPGGAGGATAPSGVGGAGRDLFVVDFGSGTGPSATLTNTIVGGGPVRPYCAGTPLIDGGHNISGDASCGLTQPTSRSSTDPRLGPLAAGGGPTLTHALLPGSPAIDTGNPTVCAAAPVSNVDQRGVARPQGPACDIGPVEVVQADLAVSLTDGRTTITAGAATTYTLTVTTTGTATVTNAAVTASLPAGLANTPTWTCTATGNGSCGAASGSGRAIATTVTLTAQEVATFTITATVAPTATGTLTTTASVAAPGGVLDPNLNNNAATDTTSVTAPPADLSAALTDGQADVAAGAPIAYRLDIANAGPESVADAVVTVTLPTGIVAAPAPTWTCTVSGGACAAPAWAGRTNTGSVTLPRGATATFQITAAVAETASGTLLATATVAPPAGVEDPQPGNNSATDTTAVRALVATTRLLEDFERPTIEDRWELRGCPTGLTWDSTPADAFRGARSGWPAAKRVALPCASAYPNNVGAWMISKEKFDLSQARQAQVDFWVKVDTERGFDGLWVLASTDGVTFRGCFFTGNDQDGRASNCPAAVTRTAQGWTAYSLNLAAAGELGNLTRQPRPVTLAFFFTSDDSGNDFAGPYLDDIALTTVQPAAAGATGIAASAVPADTWWFAEGYTGAGFDQYLTIQNPNPRAAHVELTYYLGTGAVERRTLVIGPTARATVAVHDPALGVGRGHEVATRVRSVNGAGVVAERPMYFTYPGGITGGHTTLGATATSNRWYFAEGFTGAGFDEYLTILNPNPAAAPVRLTYFRADGVAVVKSLSIEANRRRTVAVHDPALGVGRGHAVATLVETVDGTGIVAERPMYFRYGAGVTGGHTALGATAPGREWYFAEGYTGAGFDEYLTILNPNGAAVPTRLTFYLPGGQVQTKELTVGPTGRQTVAVHDLVGRNKEVAVKVESLSSLGIVAERPMYFTYGNGITGGHTVVGAAAPLRAWSVAEGYTGAGFDEYLTILNPNTAAAKLKITYVLARGGPITREVEVAGRSRVTLAVHDAARGVGRNQEVSAVVESVNGIGVVVERPMYFTYGAGIDGGHTALGYGSN